MVVYVCITNMRYVFIMYFSFYNISTTKIIPKGDFFSRYFTLTCCGLLPTNCTHVDTENQPITCALILREKSRWGIPWDSQKQMGKSTNTTESCFFQTGNLSATGFTKHTDLCSLKTREGWGEAGYAIGFVCKMHNSNG